MKRRKVEELKNDKKQKPLAIIETGDNHPFRIILRTYEGGEYVVQ
jgi:hypothetical protein